MIVKQIKTVGESAHVSNAAITTSKTDLPGVICQDLRYYMMVCMYQIDRIFFFIMKSKPDEIR